MADQWHDGRSHFGREFYGHDFGRQRFRSFQGGGYGGWGGGWYGQQGGVPYCQPWQGQLMIDAYGNPVCVREN